VVGGSTLRVELRSFAQYGSTLHVELIRAKLHRKGVALRPWLSFYIEPADGFELPKIMQWLMNPVH
jgi:hypothetical protein